jgi:3'(2'), 5'-bisphosphate nucleotidase
MKEILEKIADEAAVMVLRIYNSSFDVNYKMDHSPITEADSLASDFIIKSISSIFPDIPIISEESPIPLFNDRQNWTSCWLIDPIDGTKEFINRNDEFTINIAKIESNRVVAGIVYAPALDTMFYGDNKIGSYKREKGIWRKISCSPNYLKRSEVIVAVSRSHNSYKVNAFLKRLIKEGKIVKEMAVGSSLKLCLVAEGLADVYPRFGDTMEWDIAAGHAVLKFSGKNVYDINSKEELIYNKATLLNPHFIAE